jgi:dTDP-4-dehydrorhamnose reductase
MILVTGAAGQLGTDVVAELEKRNIDHIGTDIAELDITDSGAVRKFMEIHKPKCVIHCAAYTAVDKAEDEPELCNRVNADGTENIAKVCREINAEMIYISTDYVFDGKSITDYEIDEKKAPVSVYGKSKLAGEEAVLKHLEKHYIVRVSWVFGHVGSNFVKTMLKLAQTKDELNVVSDQTGSPTYTPDLAKLLIDMVLSEKYGVYHATNEGYCSWAEFATEIMHKSGSNCKINHIKTEQYPTKAVRPKNSRLSKTSLDKAGFSRLPAWQDALERYLCNVGSGHML